MASWRRRALQNAIDRERPLRSALRWPFWLAACALRRPVIARFATGGLRMRLVPRVSGFGSTSLFIKRDAYEPELRAVARFLRPGDVAVDIGASFGVFSLFMAHHLGAGGHVYAFEPGAFSLTQLNANIALNELGDRITVYPVAAGAAAATVSLFHVGDAPVTFSLGGTDQAAEQVPVDRVDARVPAADQPRVTFIKIDVEGYERLALEGARAIIEVARPTIMFEVSAAALARSGMTPEGLYGFLATFGYRFVRLDAHGALVHVDGCPEGNIFAEPI